LNAKVGNIIEISKFILIKIRLLSDFMIFITMSKKSINPNERKAKFSVTINPVLFKKVEQLYQNKSKYVEKLITVDLVKNKHLKNEDLY